MNFRRFVSVAILTVVASAASAEIPHTPIPDDLDPCFAFTDDASYVNHTIVMQLEHREVKMRVPIDYFEDRWDRKDGFRDTAQLFRVEIGSFLPVTRPQTAERNKKGIRNWFTFLVSDYIPMDKLAPLQAELSIRGGDYDRPLADYERMPGPFGLQEIRSPSVQSKHKFDKNIYLDFDVNGKLTTVLNCRAPGTVLVPGCDQFFEAAGLDVEMSFRRTELVNWKRLQTDVTRFLTCATSPKL
jgi:hypothetical protein